MNLFRRPLIRAPLGVLTASIFSTLVSVSAFSSQEKPIAWSELSALDLQKVLTSQYASDLNLYSPSLMSSAHFLALSDADHRVAEQFKVPAPMKTSVSFWLRIYTEYSTRQYVIYDKKHPDVVYDILDFRELFARSRNLMAYEIVRERMIKKRFAEIHAAFRGVAAKVRQKKKFNPARLKPLEGRIYSEVSAHGHKHGWAEWESNLRGQTGQRDNVMKGLLAAEVFFPKMEEIFKQLGVPPELTRIPLVESSFNLSAKSKVGATGVWQFMLTSGQEYMFVHPEAGFDERVSPLKATVAAARLLKRNLIVASNWPLAITAYNHGFTGIKRLKPAQRAEALDGSIFNPCRKKSTLGYASSNYYAEFIALLHAEKYRDLFYGESPLPNSPTLTFHRVQKSETATEYARRWGIPLKDLRLYNPDILHVTKKLPVGYFVAVPSDASDIDELIDAIRPKLRLRSPRRVTQAGPRARGR